MESQIKIKVCGLTKLNQIEELVDLKVDFLGFIFYEKSPRFVLNQLSLEEISAINHQGKVGVFVNEDLDTIVEIAEKAKLNFIQLHGNETDEYISTLIKKLPRDTGIIKVIRIAQDATNDRNMLQNAIYFPAFREHLDYLLFDTDSQSFGGTGKSFDWKLLDQLEISAPYFLSGGISLENINELKNFVKVNTNENKTLTKLKPSFALDINSKFEIETGNKDLKKIKIFISVVRA